MKQTTDSSKSDARRNRHNKESLFRAADFGVALILLVTIVASFVAYKTFHTHLAIDELADTNTAQLELWRKISGQIVYLLETDDSPDITENDILTQRIRKQLGTLLSESGELEQRYSDRLEHLKQTTWPVDAINNEQLEILRLGVPKQLIARAREAGKVNKSVVGSGFSHWSTYTHIAFQSDQVTAELRERGTLLAVMKSDSIAFLWQLMSWLVGVLFAVTCIVWLALLRPAAKRLSEARRELKMIFDTIPALVTSYNATGHLQTSNQAYLERWGFPVEGEHVSDVVGPEFWPQIQDHFNRALCGERLNFDIPLASPGGERMQNAQYIPFFDERGQVSRIVVMIADVQDRYDSARALRESEEKLRVTLDSIGDAVISTDVEGLIAHMNPVASKLTGWSLEEAINQPLPRVFNIVNRDTRKRVENPVVKVLETGAAVGLANHTVLISRDGREYDIKDSGAPILSNNNEIVGVVLVFHDATEEVALNAQIVNGEKMRAVGQLASGIAHDVNNHLAIIRGFCELILLQSPDGDLNDKMEKITSVCDRAADLIDTLNTFSPKHTGHTQPTNVRELISTTLDLLRNTTDRRIKLIMEPPSGPCIILGNTSMLQSAFMNIALNAVQAMPHRGVLSVSIKKITIANNPDARIVPFKLRAGQYLNIAFKDTGTGIPRENLDRIFEPYFSTKSSKSEGGAGLGLSMVYGVVREHQGAIFAENAAEGGAIITVLLPLIVQQELENKEQPLAAKGSSAAGLRILMVEDEERLREIGYVMLKEVGCTPTVAEDGEAGLNIFAKAPDDFDLVLLDLNMPKMSGLELIEELRKIRPQVSVIITTGFPGDVYRQTAFDPQIFAVLRKPYSFADLSKVLEQFASAQQMAFKR